MSYQKRQLWNTRNNFTRHTEILQHISSPFRMFLFSIIRIYVYICLDFSIENDPLFRLFGTRMPTDSHERKRAFPISTLICQTRPNLRPHADNSFFFFFFSFLNEVSLHRKLTTRTITTCLRNDLVPIKTEIFFFFFTHCPCPSPRIH